MHPDTQGGPGPAGDKSPSHAHTFDHTESRGRLLPSSGPLALERSISEGHGQAGAPLSRGAHTDIVTL